MDKNKQIYVYGIAFFILALLFFVANNILHLLNMKESIAITLLSASTTFLVIGILLNKNVIIVKNKKRIFTILIICVIISILVFFLFNDEKQMQSVLFLAIWLIGGVSLYRLGKEHKSTKY